MTNIDYEQIPPRAYNKVFHALEVAIYPNGITTMIAPECDPVVVRATRAVFDALNRKSC